MDEEKIDFRVYYDERDDTGCIIGLCAREPYFQSEGLSLETNSEGTYELRYRPKFLDIIQVPWRRSYWNQDAILKFFGHEEKEEHSSEEEFERGMALHDIFFPPKWKKGRIRKEDILKSIDYYFRLTFGYSLLEENDGEKYI